MSVDEITSYVLSHYKDVVLMEAYGEQSFFYNPNHDKASLLNRKDTYRLNIGIRKVTYQSRFGMIPKRPSKGGIVDLDISFSEYDRIMPQTDLCMEELDLCIKSK